VPPHVSKFAGEFTALAARIGVPAEELMADADYHAADREHWLAWDGPAVIGVLHPWAAPDGRLRLYFEACRADGYAPLCAVITGECYATIDGADSDALAALAVAGFVPNRTEREYEIPVARLELPVPPGITFMTADHSELVPLMTLDCQIRADIPGSDGWQQDPASFRADTYESPLFDPQTYQIALAGSDYVGLARVWRPLPGARYGRLGCVGVLAPYRRRGIATALIASVFGRLADVGVTAVTAEADATNGASHSLLTSLGARVTGTAIELRRPS
jgi:ribosomal protein S18 acetylase RimI-like enzyme